MGDRGVRSCRPRVPLIPRGFPRSRSSAWRSQSLEPGGPAVLRRLGGAGVDRRPVSAPGGFMQVVQCAGNQRIQHLDADAAERAAGPQPADRESVDRGGNPVTQGLPLDAPAAREGLSRPPPRRRSRRLHGHREPTALPRCWCQSPWLTRSGRSARATPPPSAGETCCAASVPRAAPRRWPGRLRRRSGGRRGAGRRPYPSGQSPRTPEAAASLIPRRGFNHSRGLTASGQLDLGL